MRVKVARAPNTDVLRAADCGNPNEFKYMRMRTDDDSCIANRGKDTRIRAYISLRRNITVRQLLHLNKPTASVSVLVRSAATGSAHLFGLQTDQRRAFAQYVLPTRNHQATLLHRDPFCPKRTQLRQSPAQRNSYQ